MGKRNISVSEISVEINAPYEEGYVLKAREAQALNQVRGENIANNCRKSIKALIEEHGDGGAEHVQALVSEYDAGYDLSTAPVSAQRLDPVEKEARNIARENVKRHLAQTGRKMSEFKEGEAKEKLAAEIARLSNLPEVRAEAEKVVKSRQKAPSVASEL